MPTFTANFNLAKPLVNSPVDEDLWGNELNDDLDIIDQQMYIGQRFVTRAVVATGAVTTADNHQLLLCDATAGAITLTLPLAATAADGFTVAIKKSDVSANAVTVDGNGTETIDGGLNFILSSQYEYVVLVCNGTSWSIVSKTIVYGTSTTLSGINTDIGNIPSWARKISVMIDRLSVNTGSTLLVQLGTSSGIEATSCVFASSKYTISGVPYPG